MDEKDLVPQASAAHPLAEKKTSDRALVWLLIALLIQNGASLELIAALVYVAMG